MTSLGIFVVFACIGYVVFGMADVFGHRVYNNHVRKKCGLQPVPVFKGVRR